MPRDVQTLQAQFAHEQFPFDPAAIPAMVSLQVINACNARCIMCAYHTIRGDNAPAAMPMDLFQKIIDEFVRAGRCKSVGLSLQCEPLLDPHLCDRIGYIKAVTPATTVGLSTNAMLLSPQRLAVLADSGLDSLNISLNAITPQSFEKVYRCDAFEQTMRNVTMLIENPPAGMKLSITAMLIKQTLAELVVQKNTIFDKAAAAGFAVAKSPISNHCGSLPEYKQLAVLTSHQGSKQKLYCHDIFESAYILSNGDVLGCCSDWRRKGVLGNLASRTFSEIWCIPSTQQRKRQMACGSLAAIEPCAACSQAHNILANRRLFDRAGISIDSFLHIPFCASNHD